MADTFNAMKYASFFVTNKHLYDTHGYEDDNNSILTANVFHTLILRAYGRSGLFRCLFRNFLFKSHYDLEIVVICKYFFSNDRKQTVCTEMW
jgi:hypothetical protein